MKIIKKKFKKIFQKFHQAWKIFFPQKTKTVKNSRKLVAKMAKGKLEKGLKIKHEDIGSYKAPKHHRKPEAARKYSKKANEKVHKVIKEFEEGKLKSGSKKGPQVKNLKQAVAIGISEARGKGLKAGEKWKKSERKK